MGRVIVMAMGFVRGSGFGMTVVGRGLTMAVASMMLIRRDRGVVGIRHGLVVVVNRVVVDGRGDGSVGFMIGVTVRLGGRNGGVVVGTVPGFVAVFVVRLLLVAHSDSVPQPLSAVFAAKSV